MTPKEKAQNLWLKYYERFPDSIYSNYAAKMEAKYFSLIAVSELIKENLRYDYIPFEGSRTEFYLQVEKELNKL